MLLCDRESEDGASRVLSWWSGRSDPCFVSPGPAPALLLMFVLSVEALSALSANEREI